MGKSKKRGKNKNAQSSIEFLIIIGFVLFFFIIFFVAIQEKIVEETKQNQELSVKEIAITVQNEINLALISSDGYTREFKIPMNLGNKNYSINITEDMVYVKTIDNKSAIALPVVKLTGNIQKGTNTIKKQNNEILLN